MNPTKTELLWAGSRYNITMLGSCAPALQLGSDTVTASDHVRVLGVTISSDLTLDKHVSKTCTAAFYWLRQLRRIRRSLDDGSAATLVHAFVTSVTDKLQRVLNAAARVVSDTRKFDRGLSTLLHDEIHWLDVPERVTFKLGLMTYRCCMDRYHGTSPITSLQPSKLHLDIGCIPPTDTGSLCLAVDSTRTAVPGLFRSLVRRSGTHCSQMN